MPHAHGNFVRHGCIWQDKAVELSSPLYYNLYVFLVSFLRKLGGLIFPGDNYGPFGQLNEAKEKHQRVESRIPFGSFVSCRMTLLFKQCSILKLLPLSYPNPRNIYYGISLLQGEIPPPRDFQETTLRTTLHPVRGSSLSEHKLIHNFTHRSPCRQTRCSP